MYPYSFFLYQNNSDGMMFMKGLFWVFVFTTVVAAILRIWQLIQEKNYGKIPSIILLAIGILFLPFVIVALIAVSATKQNRR